MNIQVVSSPFAIDEGENFPWTYDEDAFVRWVYEVLMDGCKNSSEDVPEIPISLLDAVQHAESIGYELSLKPKLATS